MPEKDPYVERSRRSTFSIQFGRGGQDDSMRRRLLRMRYLEAATGEDYRDRPRQNPQIRQERVLTSVLFFDLGPRPNRVWPERAFLDLPGAGKSWAQIH